MSAPRDLLALTVMQPWCWALAKRLKRVENREWSPPEEMIGKYIALHAGKTIDEEGVPHFRNLLRHPVVQPRVLKVNGDGPLTLSMMPLGAIVAVGIIERVVTSEDELGDDARPWFVGRYGWVFADVQEIEPVPARGFQKLWKVPNDQAATVREHWRAARRAK